MTFAEKLKSARKSAGMSQETLAEKLGVSRQAVTKWETERGIPDIENMMVISNLFGISVDAFLSKEKETAYRKGYLYESRTEYDIDGKKRFDIKLGGASLFRTFGTSGEKVVVRLASDSLEGLDRDFKVKIDDIKNRIDIDVNRQNGMTEAVAKEQLIIEIQLPNQYLYHARIQINCGEAVISDLTCEHIELGGKVGALQLNSVAGRLEVDCNLDMQLNITEFSGSLEINQISATSTLNIPDDFSFRTILKGIKSSVTYAEEGEPASDFSKEEADNIVEFNGIKSELVISRMKGGIPRE